MVNSIHQNNKLIAKDEHLESAISTKIHFWDGITRIGDIAFEEMINLTRVSIADSVTSIGMRAFYYCKRLTEVTIPESVTRIGSQAFGECHSLYEKENGITYVDNWAIDCEYEATTAVLRPGTLGVADSTFWQPSLTAIYVNDDNPNYTDIDGVLYNKAKTEVVRHPVGRSGAYTIPEGVTSIRDYAINCQAGLTSLTIPKSMLRIGRMSINSCANLTEITFLGITPPSIDETAFSGTTATVYYPDNQFWTEDVRQDYGGTLTWVAYKTADSELCGDADGDNEITDWDGILLSRYLAGWTVDIENLSAMDTDGDGEITDWDGVLLDRYLAGWTVNSQIGK